MFSKGILALALLAGPALAEPPAGSWQATENFEGEVLSNWNFYPATQTFQARWSNGNEAVLHLDSYDQEHIVITRVDSTGPTAGLRVRYEGRRSPQGYSGQVLWCWLDQARRGSWSVKLPVDLP